MDQIHDTVRRHKDVVTISVLEKILDQKFAELKKGQNQQSKVYYTRKELATLFSCNLSTIYNWTVKGKLQSYAIGNRVLYKVDEVHDALIKL